MKTGTRTSDKAIAETAGEVTSFKLKHFPPHKQPDGAEATFYIGEVNGVDFALGNFTNSEEARNAANANLGKYLDRIANPIPIYRVEKIGTVSVDVGTIVILDPCRINSLAATQDPDDMMSSPLMPDISVEPGQMLGGNGVSGDTNLTKQLLDPEQPPKAANPTRLDECGKTAGNALSLKTGLGDGEYEVLAEIIDYGGIVGQRIAAIHMQFVADEDLVPYRRKPKKQTKTAMASRN